MYRERFQGQEPGPQRASDPSGVPHRTPGKTALTDGLAVPHGAAPTVASAARAPTPADASHAAPASLQMLFGAPSGAAPGRAEGSAEVHAAADRGTATPAAALPFAGSIQRAFGRHDISGIQAHTGPQAKASADAMGARAYATGDHVVLGDAADLHTVAHEAAHVIQQRGGVQLKAGIGEVGDAHEQHADAVADRVVAGQSAEPLLDRYAGGRAGGAAVQRAVKAQKGGGELKSCNTLKSLMDVFALDDTGRRAYGQQMKTHLFAANVLPAAYQAAFATNPTIKDELSSILNGVGDLIKASGSQTVISVADNDGGALATALWAIIGPSIDANYLARYPHVSMLAQNPGVQGSQDYLTFLTTKRDKLRAYEQAKRYERHDKAETDHNAAMDNRIQVLADDAKALEDQLRTVLTEHGDPAPVVAKLNQFRTDIAIIEQAIDLDFEAGKDSVTEKLDEMKQDTTAHNGYATGGTDDGVAVRDRYEPLKACSLFALLALVPGFKGAGNPEELHRILRKTKTLANYDDDDNVAKIRLSAGLKPTMTGGRRLEDVINDDVLAKGDDRPPFIADPSGEAHTFAAVWRNGAYRRIDNEANPATDIMSTPAWKRIPIGTTWRL